mgnify:CR=1 FL=1
MWGGKRKKRGIERERMRKTQLLQQHDENSAAMEDESEDELYERKAT